MKVVNANIVGATNCSEKALVKNVLFAGNGIFEEMTSWLGVATKKVNDYELGKEYPNISESVNIHEKEFDVIPDEAIKTVIKWYRYVEDKNGEEAQINFYRLNGKSKTFTVDEVEYKLEDIKGVKFWNDNVFSYVPLQHNGSAITEVAKSDEFYDRLNEYYGMYVETHSHNSMSAFRSGTDENYSYNDGVQLVFGRLNTEDIEMYSWACVRGLQKAGLSKEELSRFISIDSGIYNDAFDKLIYKSSEIISSDDDLKLFEEWSAQVIAKPITKKSTTKSFYSGTNKSKYVDFDNYDMFSEGYLSTYDNSSYMTKDEKLELIRETFISSVETVAIPEAELIADAYLSGLRHTYRYISNIDDYVQELQEILKSWGLD